MDQTIASSLMSTWLKPFLRPDQQLSPTIGARVLVDENRDGKISRDELQQGLVRDEVSIDPQTRALIANRSKLVIDSSIMPKDRSSNFDTVEQCMEYAMRYFLESRTRSGLQGGSFDVDFGNQHNLTNEVRNMAAGTFRKPGYSAYLNGSITPPRAGDVLAAESPSGERFHVAIVTDVQREGEQWWVTVLQANIPFNSNSHDLPGHLQRLPMVQENGQWTMPPLPTSRFGYGEDMAVVGWIHPDSQKALPGAA